MSWFSNALHDIGKTRADAAGASASPAPLPYQSGLNNAVNQTNGAIRRLSQPAPQSGDIQALIKQLQQPGTPNFLTQQAQQTADQESAQRGLEGPLAGLIGTSAATQAGAQYQQTQQQQLLSALGLGAQTDANQNQLLLGALGQQSGTALQAQAAETQRRMALQQLQQMYAQAIANNDKAGATQIGQIVGMLGGAIVGGVVTMGNPAGIAAGASLGGAAGGAIGGAVGTHAPGPPPTALSAPAGLTADVLRTAGQGLTSIAPGGLTAGASPGGQGPNVMSQQQPQQPAPVNLPFNLGGLNLGGMAASPTASPTAAPVPAGRLPSYTPPFMNSQPPAPASAMAPASLPRTPVNYGAAQNSAPASTPIPMTHVGNFTLPSWFTGAAPLPGSGS